MRGNKLLVAALTATLFVGLLMIPVRAAVPPDVYLYVDGFDATWTDWTAVGASPYLDAAGDGNYIAGGVPDGSFMGWFTFEDVAPIPADAMIDKVWLEGYTDGPYTTDVDFDIYNGGFGWLGSMYSEGSPQWVRMRWIAPDQPTSDNDPTLLSEAGLNAFKVMVYYYDPGALGVPEDIVDSLRLLVTFTQYIPPVPIMSVSPTPSTAQPGESFDVEIIINPPPYVPAYDLYGYEFKLGYDPAVLEATSMTVGSFFPPDSVEWANVIDNVAGVAWLSVSMPFGSPKGVNGDGVLAVISFDVWGAPESALDLYDTLWGNRYGMPIAHEVWDGTFENVPPSGDYFAVCIKTAQKEHRRFIVSKDEDGYQTLTASIMNYGDETYAYAEFRIFDGMGAPVATLKTAIVWITQADEIVRLSVDWNGYSVPEDYSVEARVYYMDQTGAWHVGSKGDPDGARYLMSTAFRVEY